MFECLSSPPVDHGTKGKVHVLEASLVVKFICGNLVQPPVMWHLPRFLHRTRRSREGLPLD